MTKTLRLLGLTVVLAAASVGALCAAATKPAEDPVQVKEPADEAIQHYNRGLQFAKKAEELAERASVEGEADAGKLLKKAAKQWAASAREHEMAVQKNPAMHEAHSGLGYALRKSGRYEEALAAYDRALALEPMFGEAIEYRAEAYLGVGRVEDAKKAYLTLFAGDRQLADQLMDAMKSWLREREGDAQGMTAETLTGLASWLEQREEVAAQTSDLSSTQRARPW